MQKKRPDELPQDMPDVGKAMEQPEIPGKLPGQRNLPSQSMGGMVTAEQLLGIPAGGDQMGGQMGSQMQGGGKVTAEQLLGIPSGGDQMGDQMQEPAMPAEQKQVIRTEDIQKARVTLQKYKAGKASLEQRVIENEQWYRLRHWEHMSKGQDKQVEPVSAWLFNSIANKHADAMDNFPAANILPREEGDKDEAKKLTAILPVVLAENEFEETYDILMESKLRSGTGVYGVFWDGNKLNGLGDISVKNIDILSIFWEPGITDIQDSRNVFTVELMDADLVEDMYPQTKGKLGRDSGMLSSYIYDESIDTSEKCAVIDWYYKKDGLLHYCKFVGDEVLFATENEAEYSSTGWYDHGRYPFVFDPMFRVKGSPAGFGYIDVGKSAQEYIDRGNAAVLQNMLANARPRYFIRSDGSVNEAEYGDYTRDFVHVDGNLGQDSVVPINGKPLNGIYVTVLENKIDELKQVTGNRDASTGGSTAGVTAASAIAAMQEAGSKLSRDNNKASYRAFRDVIRMVVELIRQFYDLPRYFRVMGENGQEQFTEYTNEQIKPSEENGMRMPFFDIDISAQKQSPYSKMGQNELALQFFGAGFFNPQVSDQALACLDMMDFERKEFVMDKITENGTMFQQLQTLMQQAMGMAAQLDAIQGSNLQQQLMAQMQGGMPGMAMGGGMPNAQKQQALGGEAGSEPGNTRKARQRTADATAPT